MTNEKKMELSREILGNMNVTKEQYVEMCRLCDDLELERLEDIPDEPDEPSWDDILGQ